MFFLSQGDVDGAIEEIEEAHRLDPGSGIIAHDHANLLLLGAKPEQALVEFGQVLEASPDFWRPTYDRGLAYDELGRHDEAVRKLEHARELVGELAYTDGALVHAYAQAGDREKAEEELRRMVRRAEEGYVSPYGFAWAYLGLGELDTAFEGLERAARVREPILTIIGWLHVKAVLADHPRRAHVDELLDLPD